MSHFLGQPIRRGRPRASYAEMGEFDLSLIREFQARPELYDRNSPLFKDKILSAQRWQEISNKLGFDVALLKDRMLQLRNRYNIEKRRLEQLAAENPNIEEPEASPWPLFEHLQFLSDHIRPRRSYKRLIPNSSGFEEEMREGYESRKHSYSSTELAASYFANVEVKEEKEDSDPLDEPENGEAADNGSLNHLLPLQDHNSQHSAARSYTSTVAPLPVNPGITIRRLDTLRENRVANPYTNMKANQAAYTVTQKVHQTYLQQQQQQHLQQQQKEQQHRPRSRQTPIMSQSQRGNKRMRHSVYNHVSANSRNNGSSNSSSGLGVGAEHNNIGKACFPETVEQQLGQRLKLDNRAHKYTAFGYFMSTLLQELPPEKALDLVQRFTSEIVAVARNSENKKIALENGLSAGASVGLEVPGSSGNGIGISAGLGAGGSRVASGNPTDDETNSSV